MGSTINIYEGNQMDKVDKIKTNQVFTVSELKELQKEINDKISELKPAV